MPLTAADSVRVQWTGTGIGTMSLGPAIAGFQAFPASLDGRPVSYSIETEDGLQRENGIGTYTATPTNTLTRDLVTFSTAGAPTKQNFSTGTKHVRLVALAGDVVENRATIDPTATDGITLGYIAGRSRWLNTTTGTVWLCVSHTAAAAVWAPVLYMANGITFNPAAVTLSGTREYNPITQSGPWTLALAAGVAEIPGAWISVQVTGNGNPITYSADFQAVDGSSLSGAPYSGFTGARRLMIMWSGTQARALVALSGTASGGGTGTGGGTGIAGQVILGTGGVTTATVGELHRGKTIVFDTTGAGAQFDLTFPAITIENLPNGIETGLFCRLVPQEDTHPVRYIQGSGAVFRSQISFAGWGNASQPLFHGLSQDLQDYASVEVYIVETAAGAKRWHFVGPVRAFVAGELSHKLMAPHRSGQTVADVSLETVLAAGLAGNRHNTLVELIGAVDQEVDLAGLTTDSIAVITDNQPRPAVNVAPFMKVLTNGSTMRMVGPQDTAWNPYHTRAYLAAWGTAHVEYKHTPQITRISGPLAQLPPGTGMSPTSLSAGTIDFDISDTVHVTISSGDLEAWGDKLELLGNDTPRQSNVANMPPILGTAGFKDRRVNFNTTGSQRFFLTNTACPNLLSTGFSFFFVGSMGDHPSSAANAHTFGKTADNLVGLQCLTGFDAFVVIDTTDILPTPRGLLNDFRWRDQRKYVFVAIMYGTGSITTMGFHELGGPERATDSWGTPTTLVTTGINLGQSLTSGPFGYVQQIGVIPRALTEAEGWNLVKFLRLKWMD